MESKTFPEPRLGNTEFVTLITLNISIQFISNAKKSKIHFVDFVFMLAKKNFFFILAKCADNDESNATPLSDKIINYPSLLTKLNCCY